MRPGLSAFVAFSMLVPVAAQTHKVAKPEQVVRAVGVYEWTGDLKKPTGSRLVPITLFIDGALEDAGVYLARPIPFALTPGNEYELELAGVGKGTLDLAYATHLKTADEAYEDGWFGYGSFRVPPPPKKEVALKPSRNPAVLTSSKDDGRPHFGDKGSGGAGDSTKAGTDGAPAADPDRPTMRRRDDTAASGDGTTATSGGSAGDTPANDPDRPTLRRRSPEDAKKSKVNDVASVTGTGSLNNDPDRPKLVRGARSTTGDTDLPKLLGLPKDLQQMAAVSDAVSRPVHDFARPWQDEQERAAVLAKMQGMARAQLKAYGAGPAVVADTHAAPHAVVPQSAAARAAARRAAARQAKPRAHTEVALLDEELRGYTLSYGGAATYVYTARTAGTGADLRYVTVVAQAGVGGELQPAIQSVTDEAHLDRTPRMRLVDVVDAEASNRASLLMELRAQTTRQFALYRVIGTRADALFTTGTTQ